MSDQEGLDSERLQVKQAIICTHNMGVWRYSYIEILPTLLRVVEHGYCAAIKECADLGFVVN